MKVIRPSPIAIANRHTYLLEALVASVAETPWSWLCPIMNPSDEPARSIHINMRMQQLMQRPGRQHL